LVRNSAPHFAIATLVVFLTQIQFADAQTKAQTRTQPQKQTRERERTEAQEKARPPKVVEVEPADGGHDLVFGTTQDLGVLRVYNKQEKLAGPPVHLAKPQRIFVRNGYGVTLSVGEGLKKNPELFKLFPSGIITGLDLNAIASPTRTNARELLNAAAHLTDLKKLYVSGSDITDSDIDLLKRYKTLDTLAVSYTKLTGKSLASLPSLTHWKNLDANRIDSIETLIQRLPKASGIEDLRISNKNLTVKDFEIISRLPNIEFLEISKAQMNDKTVNLLARLKKLKYLAVRYCHFEGNSIEGLARLKGLKTLFISKDMVYSYPFLESSHGRNRKWTLAF